MKEFLRVLKDKNFDGINFYLNDDDNMEVTGFELKEFGEKKEGSMMGDMYDIIIAKYWPPHLPERFEAILSSPLHYISRMMDDGFVGVVVKATTTTDKFMHDIFVEKFTKAITAITVGNGMDPGVTQGPLIETAALEKVERHVSDALSKGAKLIAGGKKSAHGGNFYEPTILTNVNNQMHITIEETFGPVAPIISFDSDEEVVRLANNSQFGLAAYFYSRDIGRIWKVAEALEYGIVGVNTGIISNEVAPFGGVKQSGLGREGSVYGMDEYLEMKYVCVSL